MSLTTIIIFGFLVWLILGRGIFFQTFYDLFVQTGIFYLGFTLIMTCGILYFLFALLFEGLMPFGDFGDFFNDEVRPQMWNSIILNVIVMGTVAALYFLI